MKTGDQIQTNPMIFFVLFTFSVWLLWRCADAPAAGQD